MGKGSHDDSGTGTAYVQNGADNSNPALFRGPSLQCLAPVRITPSGEIPRVRYL